jgi:hypothetical protein
MRRTRSPGHERPKVGELDALAAVAGDLAAQHRSRSKRCDEPVQAADPGVGAKLTRPAEPALERERSKPVAGAYHRGPGAVEPPAPDCQLELDRTPRGSQNAIGTGSVFGRAVVGR